MTRIIIPHRQGEYPVLIGDGLLERRDVFEPYRTSVSLIVTDENVAPLWLPALQDQLPGAATLVLPAGGRNKTLASVESIWMRLAEIGAGRDALLFSLGGGVIGDMTGFAAACWMRGVRYVQVPTTLLAQVDASVGGKTAVDMPAGKNLVGAFHQPEAVVVDTATLASLPDREYRAGVAELIKAALIADSSFLDWIESHTGALRRLDRTALAHAIRRSCEIKAAIVSEDEQEHGQRVLLNLGHTFAHALETVTGFDRVLHGEAVSIGLLMAARLSERVCGLDAAVRPRIERMLHGFELPLRPPAGVGAETMLAAMRLDKKHRQAAWRLVLLEEPGHARQVEFQEPDRILAVLKESVR